MRAGNLDRVLTIQRVSTSLNAYGTPVEAWTNNATIRGQLLKNATDDREGQRGHTTDIVLNFRIRYVASLSLNDRLLYQGQQYQVTQISEIGRRVGMDIACERVGP